MFVDRWFEFDDERVLLRGLTFGEYQFIAARKYNTSLMYTYEIAKLCIMDLVVTNGERLLTYDKDRHFDLLFEQHFSFVEKCANIILNKLTLLSEDERNQIEGMVAFQIELREKPELEKLWSCQRCVDSRMCAKRKCSVLSEREVELVMKSGYRPPSIFPALSEQDRWGDRAEKTEEELEDIDKEEQKVEASKNARRSRGIKATVEAKRKTMQEKLAKKNEEQFDAGKSSDQFVFKSPHFVFDRCPIGYVSSELRPMVSVASRSIGSEEMLTSGGLVGQPMKFIEIRSSIQHYQNELLDKQRKIDEERSKADSKKNRSARRR